MSFFSFFFNKIKGGQNKSCKGEWVLLPVGGRRRWGKGLGGRIWYKKYIHIYVNEKLMSVGNNI
jgi:hypothetical protein